MMSLDAWKKPASTMKSFVLLRWMRMMKLSAPMFILQNITRNYVLKQTKVFGWPSICRNRSRPKGYYSPNRLSCASNLPILQGKNLMEHSEPVILLIKEMMISAHHSQRCLVQNTSLPIFFSLKILSKSQNRAWRKWLLIQSAINYVLNQTMAGVYLLSMYANLLQLKRNHV